ncbi:unnamed protein product [Cochlearia groenlandica]
MEQKEWQVWHTSGEKCPAGTIPIRQHAGDSNHKKFAKPFKSESDATRDHMYAIGKIQNGRRFYGTRATLNVWEPRVEASDDFSLAQIWVGSGSYSNGDINTVEAGWQIFPDRYLDDQPRFFTYWTRDAYNTTGCYSLHCGGFVQVSNTVALEAAIIRTSTFEGPQFAITIQIWKDQFSGNWWLVMGHNLMPIGYWPATIFTTLSDSAFVVEWGGEVLYRNNSIAKKIVQMGSGEFADKGFRKAAFFCDILVAEENHTLLPVEDFAVRASHPKSYTIKKKHNKVCGNHFFYGVP